MGFGGAFGSLFTWLLIIFGVSWLFRLFRRGTAPMSAPYLREGGGAPLYRGFGAGPRESREIAVTATDQAAFEAILKAVQDAWSKGDLRTLSHYVTPDMLTHFRDDIATYQSQGVANRVEQVELINGDVREAWDEGDRHYASCLLHWRALDYTVRPTAIPATPAGWSRATRSILPRRRRSGPSSAAPTATGCFRASSRCERTPGPLPWVFLRHSDGPAPRGAISASCRLGSHVVTAPPSATRCGRSRPRLPH